MAAVGSPGRSKSVQLLLLITSPIWAIPYFGWKLCGAKFVKWGVGVWKSIARVVVRLGDRTKFAEREREARMNVGGGIGQLGSKKVELVSGNGGGGLPKGGVNVELEVMT